jgi:hypothetical protein
MFERGLKDGVEKVISLNGDISLSLDEFIYFADFFSH